MHFRKMKLDLIHLEFAFTSMELGLKAKILY